MGLVEKVLGPVVHMLQQLTQPTHKQPKNCKILQDLYDCISSFFDTFKVQYIDSMNTDQTSLKDNNNNDRKINSTQVCKKIDMKKKRIFFFFVKN